MNIYLERTGRATALPAKCVAARLFMLGAPGSSATHSETAASILFSVGFAGFRSVDDRSLFHQIQR